MVDKSTLVDLERFIAQKGLGILLTDYFEGGQVFIARYLEYRGVLTVLSENPLRVEYLDKGSV